MQHITSKFDSTAIVIADAQGPYTVVAGSPLTLRPGATHPDATYRWDLGDGTTADGETVVHTYIDDGIYVVKLTVIVQQPGGALTRHFTTVRALNSAPGVESLADRTVDEGAQLAMSGAFTDPQWVDTHTATWNWGDSQPLAPGTVTESHNTPQGAGTVTASHAWGDAGEYVVTLIVKDDDGAIGLNTGRVTVLNVPPRLGTMRPLYAYPSCPVTVVGEFTDAGWLDAHSATWDFGDGVGPRSAFIEERHDPPVGRGRALATHVYANTGTYCCTCVVTDDDGASDTARTCLTVVDLRNRGFEDGFRSLRVGAVANDWLPYAATIARFGNPSRAIEPPADTFTAEAFYVDGGRRSQSIRTTRDVRAGICQSLGANPDWTYDVEVRYWLDEDAAAMVRLGIDPSGGIDPTSKEIVWVTGRAAAEWTSLRVRAVALDRALTVFLEVFGRITPVDEDEEPAGAHAAPDERAPRACFDRVRLIALESVAPLEAPPPGLVGTWPEQPATP